MNASHPTFPDRAELEIECVRRRSAVRDLAILGCTFLAVLQGQFDE